MGSAIPSGFQKKKKEKKKTKDERKKSDREKWNGRNMNLVAFGPNREKRLTLIDSSARSPRAHPEVPVV